MTTETKPLTSEFQSRLKAAARKHPGGAEALDAGADALGAVETALCASGKAILRVSRNYPWLAAGTVAAAALVAVALLNRDRIFRR